MDAIKKKMEKLAKETAAAEARVDHFEEIKAVNEAEAEKFEEQLRIVLKKMQGMEAQFDCCIEDLFNQTIKLEDMEKKASNAEGDVSALRSRLILLQENNEKQVDRLAKSTLELAGACLRADSSVKKRQELENGCSVNEEQIDGLEKQLKEAQFVNGESERKYEDISRKMATLEADARRGNERADGAENKISCIEEELKVVGQNLQQLEVGEEQSRLREDHLQLEILELRNKLKASDYRGENAEMNIQRLNVRIDQVEEDLLQEMLKIKKIGDEVNQTFEDMAAMSA
jgi:chromosome segregation ATPase